MSGKRAPQGHGHFMEINSTYPIPFFFNINFMHYLSIVTALPND